MLAEVLMVFVWIFAARFWLSGCVCLQQVDKVIGEMRLAEWGRWVDQVKDGRDRWAGHKMYQTGMSMMHVSDHHTCVTTIGFNQ